MPADKSRSMRIGTTSAAYGRFSNSPFRMHYAVWIPAIIPSSTQPFNKPAARSAA